MPRQNRGSSAPGLSSPLSSSPARSICRAIRGAMRSAAQIVADFKLLKIIEIGFVFYDVTPFYALLLKLTGGSGVGAVMMEWAAERCRERGCDILQLTTDKSRTDAHRFYERLGFRATHEGMKLTL
mgnify:CR=1 FL=1